MADIFKMLKLKQPRIPYPAKLFLKSEVEIKTFQDKQKHKEFVTTGLTLQEMLKGVFLIGLKKLTSEMIENSYFPLGQNLSYKENDLW